MLHPVIDNRGYYCIRISNKAYSIHRLVALAFLPTVDASLHIDHIDGNKLNNNVSNLRWCTQKENNNNPITRARISAKLTGTKRTIEQRERMSVAQQKAKPMLGKKHSAETLEKFKQRIPAYTRTVVMMDKNNRIIKVFPTIKKAQDETKISASNISSCCRGRLCSAGGYKWKYFDKEIVL